MRKIMKNIKKKLIKVVYFKEPVELFIDFDRKNINFDLDKLCDKGRYDLEVTRYFHRLFYDQFTCYNEDYTDYDYDDFRFEQVELEKCHDKYQPNYYLYRNEEGYIVFRRMKPVEYLERKYNERYED